MADFNINWDEVANDYSSDFKPYAEDGFYDTKIVDVVVKDAVPKGSYPIEFVFADTDDGKQLAKATHWLSWNKDNFRYHHMKCIMVMMGATEDNAKKAVQTAEGKGDHQKIADYYQSCLKKLAEKKPAVKIEVYHEDDSKYSRAEFCDPTVGFSRNKKEKTSDADAGTVMGGEEISIDDGDFPF